jgi:hypothetical protein
VPIASRSPSGLLARPPTRILQRLLCDDAARRRAALDAIANAQRSAGELDAAERAAADETAPAEGTSESEDDLSLFDLLGNPIDGPPRFPLGAGVECRLGEGRWLRGRVVGHFYRERSWPDNRRAPYQVQIEDDGPKIFAPSDVDDCIRTTLRFGVASVVECYLGSERGWVLGVVTKQYHREPAWEPGKWVPYQVRRRACRESAPRCPARTADSACDGRPAD